jgi:integrase
MDAYVEATRRKTPSRSKAASLAMLRARLGALKLDQITAKAIIRFAAQREAEGAGASTLLMDLYYIGIVLRHGRTTVGADPAQALGALAGARGTLRHADLVAKSDERDRRPTDEELQALFAHWQVRPCTLLPMIDLVMFACASGMRLSEILRLDRTELDRAKRTILIRDRKHPKQKKGNDQCVPLLAGPFVLAGQVIDPLAIIDLQPKIARLIFPYKPASVSSAFTKAVQLCKIDDLHFHDLRHHACSLLFEAGYQIEQVALVSGHRDWNMLRRYTKLKPETLHRTPASAEGNVVAFPG